MSTNGETAATNRRAPFVGIGLPALMMPDQGVPLMVTAKPTPITAIQFQPEIGSCQSPLDSCPNDPEWVVEFAAGSENENYPNEPLYVCTDCLAPVVDFALEIRANEVELTLHECNAVRVAKYLPTNPTIQPDRTIG